MNFKYDASHKTTFDVWDLDGKLPHLWSHYFSGAGGLIFVISQRDVEKDFAEKGEHNQHL